MLNSTADVLLGALSPLLGEHVIFASGTLPHYLTCWTMASASDLAALPSLLSVHYVFYCQDTESQMQTIFMLQVF